MLGTVEKLDLILFTLKEEKDVSHMMRVKGARVEADVRQLEYWSS